MRHADIDKSPATRPSRHRFALEERRRETRESESGDMEQSLVEDVNLKLSQLEHKVQAYRHDLVCEFGRYYGEALRGVDAPTASRISQTVAQSLGQRCPELGFGGELEQLITSINAGSGLDRPCYLLATGPDSPGSPSAAPAAPAGAGASATNKQRGVDSTQSIISSHRQSPPHAAVFGAAVAARPHERESEFHGLFTPSFLPLLESSPNLPSPASPPSPVTAAAAAAAAVVTPAHEPATAGLHPETSMGNGRGSPGFVDPASPPPTMQVRQVQDMEGQNETAEGPSTPQPGQEHRPPPDLPITTPQTTLQDALPEPRRSHFRRGTDDTSSSALSDRSDTVIPRSALRRSSSVSKPHQQSVRRVRFELRGAEVLPTASPQPSDDIAIPRSVSPDSPDKSPVFLDPVDDFEEVSLPPRKISSSEALRALSRAPLDEGTVWTVVNPDADRSSPAPKEQSSSPTTFDMTSLGKSPIPESEEAVEARKRLSAVSPQQDADSPEDSDSSDDEEFLSIGKSRSHRSTIVPVSQAATPSHRIADHSHLERSSPNKHETAPSDGPHFYTDDQDQISSDDIDAEEDDEMFHFETGGLSAPPVPKKKPPLMKDEVEDSPPLSPADKKADALSAYATSPAVPITRPQPPSGSSTPTSTKFHVGSLGSYKGRPVVMPIVKNAELLAQAQSLGEFNTFVGSLDGRSGMDDGDLNSFRASLVQSGFSGTPRSLTERMMMEEHAERNKEQ